MKLIVFGKEHDIAQELEIIVAPTHPFGMKATIVYGDGAPEGWINEVRRNLTEVHYMYNSEFLDDIDKLRAERGTDRPYTQDERIEKLKVAFESDIHYTGMTQHIDYIESVVVEYETELVKEFTDYDERADELDQASMEPGLAM